VKLAEKRPAWVDVLGKLVLYVGVPVGVLVVVWKVLESWFMGPVNAVKDLWEKQYNDYVAELKSYSEADGGNLTAEHQTILEAKTKQIAQTEKTFAQVSGNWLMWLRDVVIVGIFTIAGYYFLKNVVLKWKGLVKSGDVQSEVGQGYIAMCMMIDDFAARGLITEASVLATVTARRFETVDSPYMNSQIAYWQSQLPNLVGWQLLYAQYIITAYQTTIMMVPIWFSYLPPILRVKLV
jgi:hypothetical protein